MGRRFIKPSSSSGQTGESLNAFLGMAAISESHPEFDGRFLSENFSWREHNFAPAAPLFILRADRGRSDFSGWRYPAN
jgi:hypothetical protein